MAKGVLQDTARLALRKGSFLLSVAFVLSFVVNVLRLAGPLFMILIYDRVLRSRSVETLFALLAMVLVLMLVLGVLDYARKRIVARFAAQFQERLEHTILGGASQQEMFPEGRAKPVIGLDEADSLRGFFHSGGLIAIMDFIWTPMFVTVVFVLHPILGYICLAGMGVMAGLVLIRLGFMGGREERSDDSSTRIADLKNMVVASRDVVRSQGMGAGFRQRWISARDDGRDNAIALRDWTSWFDQLSSTTVLLVRYGVLATGAYLTLNDQLTIGAMVACTFLVTRVLIPVSRFMTEIPAMTKAQRNWSRLKKILAGWDRAAEDQFLAETGNARVRLDLSRVAARGGLGTANVLRNVNLSVPPGTMVEILGSSGRGKTTLAEAIIGLRKRSAGDILCDGIHIGRMTDAQHDACFGYVPETPGFVAGTLAENISRLDPAATSAKVASAARKVCLHAWISALPDGYDTVIDATGSELSRGQRHQIAMARALYHEPRVLIVDEPDPMLLERLPKTMKKTFDGILDAGGVILFLARKPLRLAHDRIQMRLENGVLGEPRQIRAVASDEPASGKVTKLSDKKPAADARTVLGGGV